MKRAVSLKLKSIAVLTALLTVFSLQPAQAAQFVTTMNTTSPSSTIASSTWSLAIPFNIPETATVTKIDYKQHSGIASDAYIKILRDSSGTPYGATLGTFTYSSNSNFISTYTGTAVLNGAGRYWAVFSQVSNIDPLYTTSPSYTGSPSGWTMGTTYSFQSGDSGVSYLSRGDYATFIFTLYGTGGGVLPPTSSISLTSANSINFHEAITVSATLGIAGTDGKVTFFANGKRIPGCVSKKSISLSVSCTFKPSRRGSLAITASLAPTDTGYASSVSSPKNLLVGNRTTLR